MAKEDEIKLIAYNIWQEEGCVNGQDCEHWYRAELIWKQNQKPAAKSVKPETKQIASQSVKSGGARKKSTKK
jgi:hypothetical protein